MNLPVFNCIIEENLNDESGIYAISFVDVPANNVDFVTLSSQKSKQEFLCKNQQKQILTGAILCPEQLIYRNDKRLGEYYIKFEADEIEKIARKMMKTGVVLHNTTHQHQQVLNNNYLTELWIIENPEIDKSRALGFEALPKGTLMCSYKIEDKEYWESQIMTGNIRGFSLEGFFFQKAINNSINNNKQKHKMNKNLKKQNLLSKLTRLFLDITDVEKNDITSSGMSYVVFNLVDGKKIFVDSDGFTTLNDEQLPAGEHPLSNGNILVVDTEGQFIETKESSTKTTEPEQKTAPQTLADEQEKNIDPENKETGNIDLLKNKIAELESQLSELASLAQEANNEVQKLRKVTPSTHPAIPQATNKERLKRYQQMAQALASSFRKKN